MKLLCVKCDAPMQRLENRDPDEGSPAMTFSCQTCGAQVGLLTNPGETELAGAIGIQMRGGGNDPSPPMEQSLDAGRHQRGGRPSPEPTGGSTVEDLDWTPEAAARLGRVPEGIMRDLTRQRVEHLAKRRGEAIVTVALMEEKYDQWSSGSEKATSEMSWSAEALERIERIPPFVRGMVVEAIEAHAQRKGAGEITPELVEEAKGSWGGGAGFHHP